MRDKGLVCLAVLLAMTASLRCIAAAGASGAPLAVSGTFTDGARWSILMPHDWNGTLLLYSHGYESTARPPEAAPKGMADVLTQRGYALAASSYASTGWAVAQAVPDQILTLDAFEQRYGKPRRTIAWGTSMGGLVTVAPAELHPERLDGALPSCGSLAGSLGMMNTALDGAFAFKTLLAPGSDIRLVSVDDDRTNSQRVQQVLDQAMTTPAGRARIALAAALADLSPWPEYSGPATTDDAAARRLDAAAATFAMAVFLPRVDQERRAGGVFSWNDGIDYRRQLARSGREPWVQALYRKAGIDLERDLEALDAAPRITAAAPAVAYMRAYYSPSGRLRIPLFSYHTIGDGLTAHEQQRAYGDLVAASGGGALFAGAWIARAGHCAFTPAEHLAALQTLEQRLEGGGWDAAPARLNQRAAATSLGESGFVAFAPAAFARP